VVEDDVTEAGVEVAEGLVAEPVCDGRRDPRRTGHLAEIVDVRGVVDAVLVEQVQAHDVPVHVDRTALLHLEHPPGSDPGVRAYRIEPEVDGDPVSAHLTLLLLEWISTTS
jgi:hypothetical protein